MKSEIIFLINILEIAFLEILLLDWHEHISLHMLMDFEPFYFLEQSRIACLYVFYEMLSCHNEADSLVTCQIHGWFLQS